MTWELFMSATQKVSIQSNILKKAVSALSSIIKTNKNKPVYEHVVFMLNPDKTQLHLIGANEHSQMDIPIETETLSIDMGFAINFSKLKAIMSAIKTDSVVQFEYDVKQKVDDNKKQYNNETGLEFSSPVIVKVGRSKVKFDSINVSSFPFFKSNILTNANLNNIDAIQNTELRQHIANIPTFKESFEKFNIDDLFMTMPIESLIDSVFQISPAMAVQDVRFYLNSMLIEVQTDKVSLCATDGHRIAYRHIMDTQMEFLNKSVATLDMSSSKRYIIHRDIVSELNKLNKLFNKEELMMIVLRNNMVKFVYPNGMTIQSKLIDGKYPEIHRILTPRQQFKYKEYVSVKINKDMFQAEMDMITSLLSSNKSLTSLLIEFVEVKDDNLNDEKYEMVLKLFIGSDVLYESKVPIQADGIPEKNSDSNKTSEDVINNLLISNRYLHFNPLLIKDFLEIIHTDNLELLVENCWGTVDNKPIPFFENDENSNLMYHLMPMRF